MAQQSAQTEEQRHQLLLLLTECEDRTYAADLKQALRRLRRRAEEAAPDTARLAELQRAAEEIRQALKEERAAAARVCLAELEALISAPAAINSFLKLSIYIWLITIILFYHLNNKSQQCFCIFNMNRKKKIF